MKSPLVAPSLLSCDFTRIAEESQMLNASQADWFHLDVMDGVFVPNISFGLPIIKAFAKVADKPLDVHLMIEHPDQYVADFKNAGAHHLTVHYEACRHLHRSIELIRSHDMKTGVALNPHTPVSVLIEVLDGLDIVCLMSVNPGFGGQKFIHHTLDKVKQLRSMIDNAGLSTLIEIDGGVTLDNAGELIQAGADALVAGSTVFSSENPTQTISDLKAITARL